ncbi:hypothetical protein [Nostoc sp. DedQUE09]|uniref:hypothetical protein n=1 Tax=Nostoc sp. DedQUE09 TaxID=3075394 RepID=UPI002AD5A292|nr:hypothetical protein [Nostoc sp. DedQUE09]MDZ7955633.1 hypothetical protein [Nostoc sp. DedQUE09]
MKFPTSLTSTHIIAHITLLFGVGNKVYINISDDKKLISTAVNNSHTLSKRSQDTGALKSFDTAFVAYQMMGLS